MFTIDFKGEFHRCCCLLRRRRHQEHGNQSVYSCSGIAHANPRYRVNQSDSSRFGGSGPTRTDSTSPHAGYRCLLSGSPVQQDSQRHGSPRGGVYGYKMQRMTPDRFSTSQSQSQSLELSQSAGMRGSSDRVLRGGGLIWGQRPMRSEEKDRGSYV